ncbi:MAG: hypothetical protein CL608_30920 [Anaerolineaceae bacterium]|nr:hypothetical protein [Anaerolineaceae bacterium]
MSRLSLALLGSFNALLDQKPLTEFRTNKVQALLIYLAIEAPTVHQRESLMELLWPGLPLKSAQVNLRQIVYQLNKLIPPHKTAEKEKTKIPLLITSRKTIELHPDFPLQSDANTLTTLLQRSWQHTHHDLLICPDCRSWLEAAVALYQGGFLADFSLYDSNPFEAWAQVKRESLHRKTLDALDTLTQIYLAEQNFTEAEASARRQITIDNLRENAYRQLMQILALTGRRSEAVALYETCQQLLSSELGMSPAAKTTALSEQIKGGNLTLATPMQRGIKGYELGDKLGEGAFGSVFKAFQKGVGREVAIKIIHAKYANQPQFIRRFEAEAQIVARLEHPHIVPLYDYWREPDGAYLVMRWLRGGNLQAVLEKEPLGLETAVTILTQIANALNTAHRQGIIHRDVKPANILLDNDGNAYLSDFGIARDTAANMHLTLSDELVGSPAYISPEQLLGENVTPAADVYCLGLVLYTMLTGSRPYSTRTIAEMVQKQMNEPLPLIAPAQPDLPANIDDIIQRATAKKTRDRFDDTLAFAQALHQAMMQTDAPTGETAPLHLPPSVAEKDIINPYKGLRAFQEQDAAQFYGRQALVDQLIHRLQSENQFSTGNDISQVNHRLLALVGPSGSGKSSVVKAGLIPALRQGALPGSEEWFIVEMAPGSHPLEELEAALLRVAVHPPPSLLEPLQKDERGLVRVLKRLLPQDRDAENPSQLLLIIDQFEELFTLVTSEAQRNHLLDNLLTALTDANSRLRVIITLRADFYDRPLERPVLGEWLRQRTEIVLPMTPVELEQAITAPAATMGIACEAGLAAAVLSDVVEQPGALPLMQYALTELFEQRQDRLLTLSAYQEIGGVTGALARRAEEIYADFETIEQEATRQLFLRLITLGEGVEDTRRRVRQSELQTLKLAETAGALEEVMAAYGRYRLLTFDHDPKTREATVEVAHEALLREWPRLREWLAEGREDVRQQRELARATAQWAAATQDASYLLHGNRLTQFEAWSETTAVALTIEESEFLNSSVAARNQRQAEEEARQQRELETVQQLAEEQTRRAEEQAAAAHSLRRRALFLVGALVIATILAVAAFSFARSSNSNAILASTREAEAITNASLAGSREAEAGVERATAVAAQATAQADVYARATAEADALEKQAIAEQQQAIAEEQRRLAVSRELSQVAADVLATDPELSMLLALKALDNAYTAEAEEVVRAALQASRVEMTLTQTGEDIWWIDYHPEGSWLAGVGSEGIVLWDTNNGDKLQTIPLEAVNSGVSGGLIISPDGSMLALTSQNQILILDTTSWEIRHTLEGHTSIVDAVTFNPTSNLLASGSTNNELIVWDLISGEEQFIVTGVFGGYVEDVRFSPDSSLIATADDNGFALIFDTATGEEINRMRHDALWIHNITFNSEGTRLFVAPGANDFDNDLTIWDIEANPNGELTEPLAEWIGLHANLVTDLQLSPDGRYLATASQDSSVKLWDATSDTAVEVLTLLGHPGSVEDIAFNPDSNKMATLSAGEVRIWDISEAGIGEVLNIADASRPVALHSETHTLVTFTPDGLVNIWDSATGNLLHTFDTQLQTHNRRSVTAVSPDGHYLARGSQDNIFGLWDLTTQQEVYTRTAHIAGDVGGVYDGILGIDFSPDANYLATGGADGFVKIWDIETGEKIYEWRVDPRDANATWSEEGQANGVTNVKFSPDGRYLAASTDETLTNAEDNQTALIKVWDMESYEEVTVIEDIPRRIWGLAISPDSKLIAGTGGSGVIKVWDITTGEEVANLEGVPETVSRVAFSADGSQLIIDYGKIIIYALATQEATITFPEEYTHFVLSVDGQYLAAATSEGSIQIYTLDYEELVTIAQSRITRSLTEAECKAYLHLDSCPVEDSE